MASHHFNIGMKDILDNTINVDTDTLKAILCMTNSTADTDYDSDTVSAITTLDEFDGSGFTWGHGNDGRKTIAVTVNVDDTNDEASVDPDVSSVTWASLGAGTRAAQGVLICKEGAADDTTAIPIAWIEFPSTITANGGDVTINWHADGMFTIP